jgi:hypothetical protein
MKTYLFMTIDTEEDIWGDFHNKRPPVQNVQQIVKLQDICEKYSAIPTYLVNYPVASDESSVQLVNSYYRENKCDIGSHCHPWNTPPIEEKIGSRQSFLCNIPSYDLVFRKIRNLHRKIEMAFHMSPSVFRAGRWGFGPNVLKALRALNYKTDTSITPFCDWGEIGGPVFSSTRNAPYRIAVNGQFHINAWQSHQIEQFSDCILEIPPTIGYLQKKFGRLHLIRTYLRKRPCSRLRILGILDRLSLLNYRWLSPELSSSEDMITLARRILENGGQTLNMSFHSTSLLPGKSPFVRDEGDLEAFLSKIDSFLRFAESMGIPCVGMSSAAELLQGEPTRKSRESK